VFHGGTAIKDGQLVTNGGRVLSVCAMGDTLADARERAYAAVSKISFKGMQFRRDIGSSAG
jgi:phosphoribosylamine--glycine ligase